MPGDDTKDEHIHLVVREGQKARWTDHAEEYDYDSLSAFVRSSVESQYDRDITGGNVPDALTSMQDEILIQLESMESTLKLLNENLESVRDNQLHEETIDDIVKGYTNAIERQIESLEETHQEEGSDGE